MNQQLARIEMMVASVNLYRAVGWSPIFMTTMSISGKC